MPMRASFMQIASPSPPMPPVTRAILCVMSILLVLVRSLRIASGALFHVAARRGLDRLVLRVAQLLPRRHELAPMGLQPLRPSRPPAARHFPRFRKPALRVGLEPVVHPVAALVLRGGIDGARDVARGAQHELR